MIKNIIFYTLLLIIALPGISSSQNLAGKIYYQHDIKMEFDESRYAEMTEERRDRIRMRLKEMGSMKKVLIFNNSSSLYRNYSAEKDALDEAGWDQQDTRARWRRMRPQTILWQSLADNNVVEQKEAYDKKFLITNLRERPKWKMTGKQEKVVGYMCQQAEYQKNDSTKILAWFNSQIPVPAGPAGYNELPGMIMKLSINETETVIIATKVKFYIPDENEMDKPTKGKKVTREEFEQIMEEKRQEMREMNKSGNRPH